MIESVVAEFTVMMKPVGKGRPIVTKSGAFTPNKTRSAEQAVRDSWSQACGVEMTGPIELTVWAYFERPKGHFTGKGALSKKGRENPFPEVHPDWDNVGKLVADALNGFAWRDDKSIIDGHVRKRWCDERVPFPCMVVTYRTMPSGDADLIFDLVPQ